MSLCDNPHCSREAGHTLHFGGDLSKDLCTACAWALHYGTGVGHSAAEPTWPDELFDD